MQIKDMAHLLRELERIGNLNDDEFRVELVADLPKTGDTPHYGMSVVETAEQHVLTGGGGQTPDECAVKAGLSLETALDLWGYDY